MRISVSKVTLGGAAILATLYLGGCATEEYVDKAVANSQAQTDAKLASLGQQVAANSSAISGHNDRIAALDASTQAAASDAAAAKKLAEGSNQFTVAQIGEESINFKSGSDKLSDDAKGKLADLANRLKTQNTNVRLEIHGHTDSVGSLALNEKLGSRRAEAVYEFLGAQGVPLNKMEMMSHGKTMPSAPNDSADGRAQNRRVEIEIVGV